MKNNISMPINYGPPSVWLLPYLLLAIMATQSAQAQTLPSYLRLYRTPSAMHPIGGVTVDQHGMSTERPRGRRI